MDKCKICGGRGFVFVNHGEEVLKDICECQEHRKLNGWLMNESGKWVQVKFVDNKVYINGAEYREVEEEL